MILSVTVWFRVIAKSKQDGTTLHGVSADQVLYCCLKLGFLSVELVLLNVEER